MIPIIAILYIPILFISKEGTYAYLPIIASFIPQLSNWFKNWYIIKIGGILGALLWNIYALYIGAYSMFATNCIFIVSTIISIIIYYKGSGKNVKI